jgi:hypothetical protein
VLLIRPEDEDKPKYGVTGDFNSSKYIALDSRNKPQVRDIKELDECNVEVFIIKDPTADSIFNALVERAQDITSEPLPGNLYEVFTNHTEYTEDQYKYDTLLEKVYMDKTEKTFEGIQKEVDSIKQHDRTMTSHKLNLDPMTTDKGDLDGEGLCFPLLASADIARLDKEYESIINGEDDSIG